MCKFVARRECDQCLFLLSVSSAFYSHWLVLVQAAITKNHRGGKVYIEMYYCSAGWEVPDQGTVVWHELTLCCTGGTLLLCPYMVKKARQLPSICFIRALIP